MTSTTPPLFVCSTSALNNTNRTYRKTDKNKYLSTSPVYWEDFFAHTSPDEISSYIQDTNEGPLNWMLRRCPSADALKKLLHDYHDEIFNKKGRKIKICKASSPLYQVCTYGAPPDIVRSILSFDPVAVFGVGSFDEEENGKSIITEPKKLTISCGKIPLHFARNSETVQILLDAYPEGVGIADKKGDLPLHKATRLSVTSPEVVNALIEEGLKKENTSSVGVGGGVFKVNKKGESPLYIIYKEIDICIDEDSDLSDSPGMENRCRMSWKKLHYIVNAASYSMLINEGHRELVDIASNGNLYSIPFLHSFVQVGCPLKIIEHAIILEKEGMNRTNQMIMTERDCFGRIPLAIALKTTTAITTSDSGKSSLEELIEFLLDDSRYGCSAAASMTDEFGTLPLHLALMSGRGYDDCIVSLLRKLEPRALMTPQLSTRMFPFMLVPMKENNDDDNRHGVDTAYRLLREDPTVLKNFLS